MGAQAPTPCSPVPALFLCRHTNMHTQRLKSTRESQPTSRTEDQSTECPESGRQAKAGKEPVFTLNTHSRASLPYLGQGIVPCGTFPKGTFLTVPFTCRSAIRALRVRYHPDRYPVSLRSIMSEVSAFINVQTERLL